MDTPALPIHPTCPLTAEPLDPGPDASTGATDAATAAVPQLYANRHLAGWHITSIHPAVRDEGYGQIVHGMCGDAVGSRTWVVDLAFPAESPSQDASQGTLFLARFDGGWAIWLQYH